MSRSTRDADYAAFVRAAWPRHLRTATLLTGDPHRAEELLQDCLVKLYVCWPRVSTADPHAYLRRMLANGHVSWWRRIRREVLSADAFEAADRIAEPTGAPREPDDELRRALLALPYRQRAVVVLRHIEDLSEKETAAVLGCTVGSVKSQNFRAMARLREALREYQEAAL
ncbi:SigE family RNA polymerase sigma factor [Kitasatospora paracochleata]|uniref:RNA polymerase sigma-70 factor (Sigma-E family) n=1 Tax=Kitasatospora paracochleata TaxID=58354 RepID=A0ABT1JA63_9ACTN|nr:SigE family RNA polymerase sigma factor [Kitasatospora paracochleata]MCP2314335.1 RNA polymerase sigma-70 factor (sigma-E family) [Kitasatospora paracochleata]